MRKFLAILMVAFGLMFTGLAAANAGSGTSGATNFYYVDSCSFTRTFGTQTYTYKANMTNYDHKFIGYTVLGQQYHLATSDNDTQNFLKWKGWTVDVSSGPGGAGTWGSSSNPDSYYLSMETYKNYATDYKARHTFRSWWQDPQGRNVSCSLYA